MKTVRIHDLNDALYLFDIPHDFEVMTAGRLRYLEQKYKIHLNFYKLSGKTGHNYRKKELETLRERSNKKHDIDINFKLETDFLTTINGILENFELIFDERMLPRLFFAQKLKTVASRQIERVFWTLI